MLPRECSRRLVAELQGALDACAERQLQLEQSLRVCRRLLQAWEPTGTRALEPPPGPETKEEDPPPGTCCGCLWHSGRWLPRTQGEARSLPRQGQRRTGRHHQLRDRFERLSSGSLLSLLSEVTVMLKLCQLVSSIPFSQSVSSWFPAASGGPSWHSAEPDTQLGVPTRALAYLPGPSLLSGITMSLCFLGCPMCAPSLWAQLRSMQTTDTAAAKTRFLQNMQTASGGPQPRLSTEEVEAETGRLWKACSLLRLRMREELSAAPTDWMQEYRCLLTLEGLQAMVGQCLHRLQELRAAVAEQPPRPCPVGRPPRTSPSCGGGTDPAWSPQLLVYSSTQELQTLAALRLRVAMLEQQIHLEKVLMAELLPVVSATQLQGPPWLTLCRAAHSLLCEGGARVLTVLRDDPVE
ncbi:tubulin epsilon and delta complex protein 2 isoform X7 [Callithrix jacchus]